MLVDIPVLDWTGWDGVVNFFLVFLCVGGLLGPRPWRWTGYVIIVIFGEG